MNKDLYIRLTQKTCIMFGFTYFTAAVVTQSFGGWKAALMATGLYLFTELTRIYKVNKFNDTMILKKKAQKRFVFLV